MIKYVSNNKQVFDQTASFEEFKDWAESVDEYQLDTETEGKFDHINHILLIQFGTYDTQYVLDFLSLLPEQKQYLLSILVGPKLKILHNAAFDIKFLWREGLDIKNVYDTMLAEILLYAGRDDSTLMESLYYKLPDHQKIGKRQGSKFTGWYSLQRVAYSYTNVYLDKSERGNIIRHGISKGVIEYSGKDVKYLSSIKDQQLAKLKELGIATDNTQDEYTVLGLENRAVISFAHMEYCGIKLDHDKWKKVVVLCKQEVKEKINSITELVWKDDRFKKYRSIYQDLFTPATKVTTINWSSPAQKLEFLKIIDPTVDSTNERTLSKLKKNHPEVKYLIEYNKSNKLLTAFADKMYGFVNPKTKRVHTQFWQILSTGRVSSNKPNMQQIPSRSKIGAMMRECFVSQKGYKIVGGDFSGAELRIIAEFSKDPVWINAFLEGEDLHSVLCSKTFDIPIANVKDYTDFKPDIKYRDVQKTINFGLAYGMSHFKLADTMEIPESKAKNIIDKYFKEVPLVKKFLTSLGNLGRKRKFIKTAQPYGRYRFFDCDDPNDFKRLGAIERASKNHPIQGTNADMVKLALIKCYDYIRERDWWNPVTFINDCMIVLTVHDEIQSEVKDELAEEWKEVMNRLMLESGAAIVKTIPMSVDCTISDYWTK